MSAVGSGSRWGTDLSLLGDGFFGEVAQDGELVELTLRGLDDHPDPSAEDGGLDQAGKNLEHVRDAEDGLQDPIGDEPGDEEVESLEGIEADAAFVAETRRRENHDGDHPTDDGDVAQQGRRAGTDAV